MGNAMPEASSPTRDVQSHLRGEWVNPNANCPVCGCAVYFYRSPHGGSVYFDELGPPWPKHACTDTSDLSHRAASGTHTAARWDHAGWEPLVDFQVSLVSSGHSYRVRGRGHSYDRTLLFRLNASFEVEMVRFKEGAGVDVQLSMLARDPTTKEWLICEGSAKIAPNYPPTEELVILKRIPNADIAYGAMDAHVANGEIKVICEPAISPAAPTSAPLAHQADAKSFPLERVEVIDERIRLLLDEIAQLNEEKTKLIRSFLK